jgi:hypothetical protein
VPRNYPLPFARNQILEENLAMGEVGKFLVIIGVVIALIGLLFWGGFAPRWLGRLPGDIRIERGNSAFYFPIVTCIILSILLSLLLSIFRR